MVDFHLSGKGLSNTEFALSLAASTLLWVCLFATQGQASAAEPSFSTGILRISSSAGVVISFAALSLAPNILGMRTARVGAFISVGIAMIALSALSSGLAAENSRFAFVVLCARDTINGIAIGISFSQCGVFLASLLGKIAAFVVAVSLAAAGLVTAVVGFLPNPLANSLLVVSPLASLVSFLALPIKPERRIGISKMLDSLPEMKPLYFEMFLCSFIYGICFMAPVFLIEIVGHGEGMFNLFFLIPGFFLLVMVLVFHSRLDFDSLRFVILPLIAISLLPLLILDETGRIMSFGMTIALFQVFDSSCTLTFAEITRENGLPPISSFSSLRFIATMGIFLGRIFISVIMFAFPFDTIFPFRAFVIAIVALIILWIALGTSIQSKITKRTEANVEVKTDAQIESDHQIGRWKRKVLAVAKQFGLSKRETEVFALLAKGRNAEYVEKQLYISDHTARSHIYRIYKKMDIHSQQELLDVLESFNPDESFCENKRETVRKK